MKQTRKRSVLLIVFSALTLACGALLARYLVVNWYVEMHAVEPSGFAPFEQYLDIDREELFSHRGLWASGDVFAIVVLSKLRVQSDSDAIEVFTDRLVAHGWTEIPSGSLAKMEPSSGGAFLVLVPRPTSREVLVWGVYRWYAPNGVLPKTTDACVPAWFRDKIDRLVALPPPEVSDPEN